MLLRLLVVLYFVFGVPFAVARSTTSKIIVCVPGQCLQGFSNVTLGETLSAQGDTSVQLLPGQYSSTTPPQSLHIVLTSASASLSLSAGFNSSSLLLPLTIALQPGIAMYSNALYSGQPAFLSLPSTPMNSSISLPASSLALANNVWAALTTGSSRIIFWDSVPDVAQLPSAISLPLALVDIQSSTCSPPCSSSTICSANSTCACPRGFTGSACESCDDGFFGPTCQPCPSQCHTCDQGTSGSGRCITPVVPNAPETCNCLNGLCGTNGTCTCNPGWTKAANGTACGQCAPGFYLTSTGDCQICQFGCTQCLDGTGNCISCKDKFTQNPNDKTRCDPKTAVTATGDICPDGSYSAGNECGDCSPTCTTCNGPTSKNCIACRSGLYQHQGRCVAAGANGVCAGTRGMFADNNKLECDACGAKCTSCEIPGFVVHASIASQRQCTKCLPGSFLSNGTCSDSCPSGTFVSPKDNLTCTSCTFPCGSCLGSADFCLSCTNQQLAFSGGCVATCPAGTFSSSGACLKCHPDCRSCTGESFDQCSTCPSTRPVISSGRCLPTCGQSKYFDLSSSSCLDCDSSCSSCSGSGSDNCLACSNPNQVLRSGSCVSADCSGSTSVIPNLGICLSDLVQGPLGGNTTTATATTSGTISSSSSVSKPPIPSSGATAPVLDNGRLLWWQILLMVLGGILFFIFILVLWRKLARSRRAEETVMFASARQIDGTDGWGWRLKQVKNILFGGKKGSYDIYDYPPMTSYGYGENALHQGPVGRNLDIEPPNPMTHYLDDTVSTYSIPRSIQHLPSTRSQQYPLTKHRSGGRSSERGYRSNDPSPTREYHSDIRSPTRRHRSSGRSSTRKQRSIRSNRSPPRGYRSNDPSPARLHYLSDDRYPLQNPPSTRKPRSINRSLARGERSEDLSPARLFYLSDDHYPPEKQSSTRKNRSDDPSPARLYYLSDDPYPPEKPRKYHSNNRSPTKDYPQDIRSPTREYPPDIRSPTREYPPDIRSPTREYPSYVRPPAREYPPDVRHGFQTNEYPPPIKDRWEDRLDNSLSRYPRKEVKPPPSLQLMSPPPSYPANSDRGGHASKY